MKRDKHIIVIKFVLNPRKLISLSIEAKTILTEEHLRILRPGSGISPMDIGSVLGKEVTNSLPQGHILTWNDLK